VERIELERYKKEESEFYFGRTGMNAKYPNEFEVYMVALELVDGDKGDTLEYFSFPVMPFQIQKNEPTRTNIKKSASGITVISNDSFVPQEVTIKGDFGRGFKMILNPVTEAAEGVAFKGFLSETDSKNATFSSDVKTGFGAIKILQNIINKSNKLSKSGKPNRLYLYNMALSESYIVAVPQSGLILTQTIGKNMIWEYSLTLTVLAPLDKIKTNIRESSAQVLLYPSTIENQMTEIATKSNWFLKNSTKALDFLKDTSKFDVSKYLTDFVKFAETQFPDIVNYYKIGVDVVDSSFNMLDYLWRQAGEVESMMDDPKNIYVNCEIWELADHFSDIQRKLETAINMGRWSRSSRANRNSDSIKVDYIQRQGESIERISTNTGATTPDDSWIDIAIDNDLNEEKYTSTGGVLLSISFKNNVAFGIKNIVDSLNKETIYGKDIKKRMEISSGDYITLQGWNSLVQTFDTILATMKGSIPEFPEDGTSHETIGSNMNIIGFPSLFRNLLQMFKKDDRFSSVDLVDLYVDGDSVFMKIKAETKIGKQLISNILI